MKPHPRCLGNLICAGVDNYSQKQVLFFILLRIQGGLNSNTYKQQGAVRKYLKMPCPIKPPRVFFLFPPFPPPIQMSSSSFLASDIESEKIRLEKSLRIAFFFNLKLPVLGHGSVGQIVGIFSTPSSVYSGAASTSLNRRQDHRQWKTWFALLSFRISFSFLSFCRIVDR